MLNTARGASRTPHTQQPMTPSLVPVDALPAEDLIPAALLGLLERRYLNELNPDHWSLTTDAGSASPLLHEVTVLGVAADPQAMPVALSSVHEPGQALIG